MKVNFKNKTDNKRITPPSATKDSLRKTTKQTQFKAKQVIRDARERIIEINRSKIRDARDKLNEFRLNKREGRHNFMKKNQDNMGSIRSCRDARDKLNMIRKNNGDVQSCSRSSGNSSGLEELGRNKNHLKIPRRYVDYDNMVESDDPFNVYKLPSRKHHERRTPPTKPASGANDSRTKSTKNASNSSSSVQSRVRVDYKGPESGYRLIVSNLPTSVTEPEIRELFECVGELTNLRIVQPGKAEMFYEHYGDAEMAVDLYHNRLLDNQPMKCYFVDA